MFTILCIDIFEDKLYTQSFKKKKKPRFPQYECKFYVNSYEIDVLVQQRFIEPPKLLPAFASGKKYKLKELMRPRRRERMVGLLHETFVICLMSRH